jgi:hypothetical protein
MVASSGIDKPTKVLVERQSAVGGKCAASRRDLEEEAD